MRFWPFIWISLSSKRRDKYIVRKILSICSRLSLGDSTSRVFVRFDRLGLRGGTSLVIGAGTGFGSGFATARAVKVSSGSDSDFFTSLKTFVSLMFVSHAPAAR